MNSSLQMLETNRDRHGSHGTAEQSHFHMGIGDLNVFICQCFYILLSIKCPLLILLTIIIVKVYDKICYTLTL